MCNTMSLPFLSIVVPVFNVEKYLKRCLDSILGQTFENYELICVDDGSTDFSLKILEDYAKKDQRMKIVIKENGGLSSARNAGLEVALGEWVLFVDSDDLLGCHGKTSFDELANLCSQTSDEVDWIVAQSTVFYEDGYNFKNVKGDLDYFHLPEPGIYNKTQLKNMAMNVCAWGKLYKRSLIEENQLRFPEGLRYEDEFWYPCYYLISNKIKVVDVKLYSYFRRNDSIMGKTFVDKDILISKERVQIAERVVKYFKGFNLTCEDRSFLLDKIFGLYNSAIGKCPLEDKLYIYWYIGKVLRDNAVDCQTNFVLKALKQGNSETKFMKHLYKLRQSVAKRFRKLKQLR